MMGRRLVVRWGVPPAILPPPRSRGREPSRRRRGAWADAPGVAPLTRRHGGRHTIAAPPRPESAMPLTELNHYFVRANDLEQTRRFYCEVLGFEVMPRPDFPFPG